MEIDYTTVLSEMLKEALDECAALGLATLGPCIVCGETVYEALVPNMYIAAGPVEDDFIYYSCRDCAADPTKYSKLLEEAPV